MKASKYFAIVLSLFGAVNAQAAIIPAGGFGVNSNFIDNGIITTEYRADGTVWEWLDLTVTNGIAFDSLVDDLNDDNTLNNSNTSTMNANTGAHADVAALKAEHATGWGAVGAADVAAMFNSFFGTSLSVGQSLFAPESPLHQTTTVEYFISIYGDTYHDGREDANFATDDTNPELPNIGYTYGMSNTVTQAGAVRALYVLDGQYGYLPTDQILDRIHLATQSGVSYASTYYGTWLNREVTTVSEPTTAVMFTLGLMGLFVRRRLG